jgi:hypothetical protein
VKPYDKKARCPKCGSNLVGSGFHSEQCMEYGCPGRWDDDEHILRHCQRCHYEWLEAPLDAKEGAA